MDAIKESVVSHKLSTCLLDNLRRALSWRVLALLIILSLIVSMIGFSLPTPALADNEGEETAGFLPSDTDLYLTVNLDPGVEQLLALWSLANYWLQDSDFQGEVEDFLGELEVETDPVINIIDDVLPWLGPEIAIGVCNLVPENQEEYVPELAIFIGTADKEASDSFFKDQFIPNVTDETGIEDSYREIETLYFSVDEMYCALADEYIVISTYQSFLESTLDIMLDDLPSLADDEDFQQCQDALPANRVGMLYCNTENIWNEAITSITNPEFPEDIFESLDNQIPPRFAASVSFADSELSMSAYFALPDGSTLPTTETYSPQSPAIVPDDALLFASAHDANAYWEEIRSLIAENWDDLVQGVELPSVGTFEDMLGSIEYGLGVDIDNDIFGWMTGECSIALLSLPTMSMYDDGNGYGEQSEIPDVLIMFEVEDMDDVDGYLNDLIDGLNSPMLQMIIESEFDLSTTETEIDGVDATLFTSDAIDEAGASPGWLFLDVDDVDSTHYLVIGTTTDALAAAVDASQGDIPSLDEDEKYNSVQSLLPDTVLSMGYLNLAELFEGMVSGIEEEMRGDVLLDMLPPEILSELGLAEFDMINSITSYFPSQFAVGCSCTLADADGIVVTGALYMQPPPLVVHTIEAITNGTVEIPEQTIDFTQLDPDVGQCAVSVDVEINSPGGASIEVTAMKEVSAYIASGFALAAEDAGLSIEDIAYVITVEKNNLTAENVGAATITMKVGRTWADSYGTDNIKIIRISDGVQEVLPTTFTGYEGGYAVFEGVSEDGLSYFGMVAVSSAGGTNWALIGGIIGAAVFVVIVLTIIWRVRRTA
ncbi:DUF3352 domain-containing protein [Chloroflexota bacterium]